jgi:hypothetical protein
MNLYFLYKEQFNDKKNELENNFNSKIKIQLEKKLFRKRKILVNFKWFILILDKYTFNKLYKIKIKYKKYD